MVEWVISLLDSIGGDQLSNTIIVKFTYSVPEYISTDDISNVLMFDTTDEAQQFVDDIVINGVDGCWPVNPSSIYISR